MRFSGGPVGGRGAKNALVSHVGRLEVVRWTVLSRLALCLMVEIVRTHATRSAPRSFRTIGKSVIGGGDGHIVGTNTRIALGAGG